LTRLAIISTHPIQYNAPLFRELAMRKKIEVKVFYTWSQSEAGQKFDPGFGKEIQWDLPLLEGYDYMFSKNVSTSPGSHHFKGIDNPFLIKEVKNWNANALLVYGWSFKSHFKVMRYFKGKLPILFRGDSTLLDEKPGFSKLIRRVALKFIYSYINVALYAGKANKAYFKAHGVKDKALVFMPHAIDNGRFAVSQQSIEQANAIRAQLGIPSDALVFLYAGKLDANKNTALLINAFIGLKSKTAYLLITGNGACENELKLLYENNNNICFMGFQNQLTMPGLYACSNVFVLPSKSETWGLAINEAMAAGKAIVLSDTCGAALDLVEHGANGFIFENNNLAALKKCLQYFIETENAANEMGKVSLQKIHAFSYENDCVAIEKVLT
jgi:glycosyltransferase involved in cell wall biosynthesis